MRFSLKGHKLCFLRFPIDSDNAKNGPRRLTLFYYAFIDYECSVFMYMCFAARRELSTLTSFIIMHVPFILLNHSVLNQSCKNNHNLHNLSLSQC